MKGECASVKEGKGEKTLAREDVLRISVFDR